MTTLIKNLEIAQLLKLSQSYRDQGYEVIIHPNVEYLPEFLKNYRPDMIARSGDEAVIVEVKSRSSLNFLSKQYLRSLAQVVEEHSEWRFELIIVNPDEDEYIPKAESSLEEEEIKSQLQIAKQMTMQHPESSILYIWALTEATLRLVTEKEGLSLQRFDVRYLVKQLLVEGVISRTEYQLLMDANSLRNMVGHGFKAPKITMDFVDSLIQTTEQLLEALHLDLEAS
jgi:hypothetical protein